jgi:hypothetical protein
VFRIGCFQTAGGCGVTGTATTEFTWFPGFSWEIAYCRACLDHLGWYFSSAGRGGFFGLILDRLLIP